ncbi:hypothetical protein ACIBH1_45135 [Nonomuraea sp. NPDC050663]|uniref:hypothetical protein n=1 Tax=Nonomuraea sp. NPDC050663 TaxID=3364370 RepID=UPI0037ADE122
MGYKPRITEKTITLKGADVAAGTHVLWRAPVPCRVVAVRAYRIGGSGAAPTVNAHKNGVTMLTGDLSVATATTWTAASLAAVAARRFVEGDTLAVQVVTAGGTAPTDLIIQVDIQKDANF